MRDREEAARGYILRSDRSGRKNIPIGSPTDNSPDGMPRFHFAHRQLQLCEVRHRLRLQSAALGSVPAARQS
jgi:hypothetical protein